MTSKGKVSSIENLVAEFPQVCGPVQLRGVTVLYIGKVSVLPNNDKGQGQGEKGKTGKGHGKNGKGMIEAGTQKMQPVYLGDDDGRVICTLATGDVVNPIPVTFPRNA